MKSIEDLKLRNKLDIRQIGADGGQGYVYLGRTDKHFGAAVVFSWGGVRDHVSVSYPDRCPTWNEMCIVKDIFFRKEECALQFHPPKKDYINCQPFCLHLWRWQNGDIIMPPKWMVG